MEDKKVLINMRMTKLSQDRLKKIAEKNRRSMTGMILWWIDEAWKKEEATEEIPHLHEDNTTLLG